jgi:hypothetical protein
MRGEMMMIAKMYEGHYDPDTDPQLVVALKQGAHEVLQRDRRMC